MGSASHENAPQRESCHASEHGRTEPEPAGARREAQGSQEGHDRRRKVWCVRSPAAEHQVLVASRNTSQVFGFSDSMCLASRHLPHDSGTEVGSAAACAGVSTPQKL